MYVPGYYWSICHKSNANGAKGHCERLKLTAEANHVGMALRILTPLHLIFDWPRKGFDYSRVRWKLIRVLHVFVRYMQHCLILVKSILYLKDAHCGIYYCHAMILSQKFRQRNFILKKRCSKLIWRKKKLCSTSQCYAILWKNDIYSHLKNVSWKQIFSK